MANKKLAHRYDNSTNVFGPRPPESGFRCMHCGTEEYPLFGVALACPRRQPRERQSTYETRLKEWEPESNRYNSCKKCLSKCKLYGKTPDMSDHTRKLLEERFVPELRTKVSSENVRNGSKEVARLRAVEKEGENDRPKQGRPAGSRDTKPRVKRKVE